MSRALLRSVLELRTPITRLPPPFLLPIRTGLPSSAASARFFNQTSQIVEPSSAASAIGDLPLPKQNSTTLKSSSSQASSSLPPTSSQAAGAPPPPATGPIDESVRTLLPLLAAQPGHYVTVHIHGRPYLVTEGDSVRLPFKMPGVAPGDVLRLNRASVVGSRDYTLQGAPYVDERLFECRAVVTGTEAEPMRVIIKKKRRCRRKKRVESKHRYTMLRISEVKVCADVAAELD
ncbi:putative ribosomal protein [Apodospora peruviana]|uniref:Large ribosomal subunit protein bL21m n=1 Tax=Apodospora peruviana TaxID=516989 RepID=A0AAE0MG32_9PEZI|nr:putative ribosomal protein [Apodospora peruviana]